MNGSEHEFPPAALFRSIAICPWREHSPELDGVLEEWSERELMPPLAELAGGEQYADLYLAWNGDGLYLALSVPKQERVVINRQSPGTGDALQLFIDTRGAETGHRATQFCHHLVVFPTGAGPEDERPSVVQRPLRRALQRAPEADFDAIGVASSLGSERYVVELGFPPESLHGYEPEEGLRIAMAAVVSDIQRGTQYWGTAPDLPYLWDPSTWGLVEHGRRSDRRRTADPRAGLHPIGPEVPS